LRESKPGADFDDIRLKPAFVRNLSSFRRHASTTDDGAAGAWPASAPDAQQATAPPEEVDVALVLAVDVSYSMDLDELALQRNGYIEAFRSKQLHDAIAKGAIGKIAVTYFEWAGGDFQHIVRPWTVIETPQSAIAFAEELGEAPTRRGRPRRLAARGEQRHADAPRHRHLRRRRQQ
jgi:hypothetical protein